MFVCLLYPDRIPRVYGIQSLRRYEYTVATRNHLKHPWVTRPRIQNSQLPWDTVPEVKIFMLLFIMFHFTPSSGIINNYGLRKSYRAPHAQTQTKKKEKRRIFAFGPNIKKERKYGRCLEWGSITYTSFQLIWLYVVILT